MKDRLQALETLHGEIDELARVIAGRHAGRLRCAPGCRRCCVDGITVFEIEAALILRRHSEMLRSGSPGNSGACPFLDERDLCRVYPQRPYVCRTQGLPLRWVEEYEYRDICPLNDDADRPLQSLDEADCWTIGPFEHRLAALQREYGGGSLRRVALRDLFENPTSGPTPARQRP
jgi:hypothetical protein